MEIILQIVLLLIIALILKDVKLGMSIFLAYTFLVPYCQLGIGGFVLKQNLINTIILLSVWIHTRHFDLKPFYAFVIFYCLILFAIPFTDGVGFDFQIDNWRSAIMLNLFVPITIWNIHFMKDAYSLLRNLLITAIIIACVYGIILTTMEGINPYALLFYTISGEDYRYDWFAADTRLFGRISSVFLHPMSYGMFLGCAMIYTYSIRKKISNWMFYVLLFLILTNIVICGVRSVLFASVITILYFFAVCGKFKLILIGLGLALLTAMVVYLTPELNEYFKQVTDVSDQNEIGGSNLDMRLSQLDGCFREIRDCFFLGKGHAWHADYMVKHETHPSIFGFESLIFIILCDYGIFGFFIYGVMLLVLFVTQRKYIKSRMNRLVLNSYTVFYLTYCIITGDYSYMKIWLIFYYLTFSEMYVSQSTNDHLDSDKKRKSYRVGGLYKRTTPTTHVQ